MSMLLVAGFFTARAQIVITEIMYNPPESGQDSVEYIEFYNNSNSAVDLTDWTISDGVVFTFPAMSLAAGEYVVVAKNDTAFAAYFGFKPLEWADGSSLKNSGEKIAISDANGTVVDSVVYDDQSPWDADADGGGASLVLCDYNADNNDGANWIAAKTAVPGLVIGGKQVYANPGAESGCPSSMELNDDSFEAFQDIPAVLDVLDNDVIPNAVDSLTVPATTTLGGTLTVTADNKIVYTPPSGVCGQADGFTYTVVSGGATATANVHIDIQCAPAYAIGQVTTEDADGVADSLGVTCTLTGVVYGVDLKGGNGVQFTIIDANGDGIGVYSGSDLGYTVQEGDEVTIVGEIGQFRGLTQIYPASITKNSGGNSLLAPEVVTELGEATESKLIKLENMHLADPSEWTTGSGGSGFNVHIVTQDGQDTFLLRIDNDVDAYNDMNLAQQVTAFPFHVTGIGGQYDPSAPYTEGYQILPRYAADFDIIDAVVDPSLLRQVRVYPNPTVDEVTMQFESIKVDRVDLYNSMGQRVRTILKPGPVQSLDMRDLPDGVYSLKVLTAGKMAGLRVVKL